MSPKKQTSSRERPEAKSEAEDVFVEKTLGVINWAKGNGQTLVLVGIVLAVFVAGGMYYANYKNAMADRAITQLELVQNSVGIGDREHPVRRGLCVPQQQYRRGSCHLQNRR